MCEIKARIMSCLVSICDCCKKLQDLPVPDAFVVLRFSWRLWHSCMYTAERVEHWSISIMKLPNYQLCKSQCRQVKKPLLRQIPYWKVDVLNPLTWSELPNQDQAFRRCVVYEDCNAVQHIDMLATEKNGSRQVLLPVVHAYVVPFSFLSTL